MTIVSEGQAFCEAVLWMPWVHRGNMKALTESDIVAMDSKKFREVTLAHPTVLLHAHRYARFFRADLQDQLDKHKHAWDLPFSMMHPDLCKEEPCESPFLQELQGAERVEAMMLMETSSSEEDVDEDEDELGMRSPRHSPYPSACAVCEVDDGVAESFHSEQV